MSNPNRIVAVGLLTERDIAVLGQGFKRAYPLGHGEADFARLLASIDKADRAFREAGASGRPPQSA